MGDDDRGFDQGNVPLDHLGLAITCQRAQAISTDFEIVSQPGRGTKGLVNWEGDE